MSHLYREYNTIRGYVASKPRSKLDECVIENVKKHNSTKPSLRYWTVIKENVSFTVGEPTSLDFQLEIPLFGTQKEALTYWKTNYPGIRLGGDNEDDEDAYTLVSFN